MFESLCVWTAFVFLNHCYFNITEILLQFWLGFWITFLLFLLSKISNFVVTFCHFIIFCCFKICPYSFSILVWDILAHYTLNWKKMKNVALKTHWNEISLRCFIFCFISVKIYFISSNENVFMVLVVVNYNNCVVNEWTELNSVCLTESLFSCLYCINCYRNQCDLTDLCADVDHLYVACGSACVLRQRVRVSQQVRLAGGRGVAGGFGDGWIFRRTLRAQERRQAGGACRWWRLHAARRSVQITVSHAAAFHLLGSQRTAGRHLLLLDRHAIELLHLRRRLQMHHVLRRQRSGTVLHALPLVQLHAQLLHLPLLLVQLPRQLLDHLLLLHQHLVLLGIRSQRALGLVCAQLGRRRLQAELRRGHGDVAEAVGQRAADGEIGWGRRDGWRGAAAAERVEAGAVWLVGRERAGGRHGEHGCADVCRSGWRGAAGVFERPQTLYERRLSAGHGQTADPQLLPEFRHLPTHNIVRQTIPTSST